MTFTRQTTPKAFPSITELARALRAGDTYPQILNTRLSATESLT